MTWIVELKLLSQSGLPHAASLESSAAVPRSCRNYFLLKSDVRYRFVIDIASLK